MSYVFVTMQCDKCDRFGNHLTQMIQDDLQQVKQERKSASINHAQALQRVQDLRDKQDLDLSELRKKYNGSQDRLRATATKMHAVMENSARLAAQRGIEDELGACFSIELQCVNLKFSFFTCQWLIYSLCM